MSALPPSSAAPVLKHASRSSKFLHQTRAPPTRCVRTAHPRLAPTSKEKSPRDVIPVKSPSKVSIDVTEAAERQEAAKKQRRRKKESKRSYLSRNHRRTKAARLAAEEAKAKRLSLEHSDALLMKTAQAFANPAKFYNNTNSSSVDDLLDLSLIALPQQQSMLSSITGSRDTLNGSARDLSRLSLELPSKTHRNKTRPPPVSRSPTFYDKVVDLNKRRSLTIKGIYTVHLNVFHMHMY